MRRMRRRVVTSLVLLILGAILNIAVAWGCAWLHGSTPHEWKPFHNPTQENPLVIFVISRLGYQAVSGCGRSGTLLAKHADEVQNYSGALWWDRTALGDPFSHFGKAAGFPFLSLSTWHTTYTTEPPEADYLDVHSVTHWGIPLTTKSLPEFDSPILPLRPIWPGFAVNMLAYAGLLWGLFLSGSALRRALRAYRRQCRTCGYPIGTSPVCTECGAAVLAR